MEKREAVVLRLFGKVKMHQIKGRSPSRRGPARAAVSWVRADRGFPSPGGYNRMETCSEAKVWEGREGSDRWSQAAWTCWTPLIGASYGGPPIWN